MKTKSVNIKISIAAAKLYHTSMYETLNYFSNRGKMSVNMQQIMAQPCLNPTPKTFCIFTKKSYNKDILPVHRKNY